MRLHTTSQLLKAYTIYEKDKEYVVKEGKIIIIDQNTGREMPGRRWSEGLHQAVEANHHHSELLPPVHTPGRHDRHSRD